ncbi:5'-nucleotidase, lipoprotein e(P4) family [Salicibibacter cibi]|uniref:5'-nucleotidase, lipoprotein e(P4) family n=1 Tax=Salicibibacter cibi TaxID=2743001 RepID=A0A7T6ZCI4_9BACI|nr:5'-nucleotidase, lipoprotein e(P4) family [Salicibibacter cibi]QQK80886.1 5'-nucleotidase, lipoprotein e(P4) family [Salicibibacter cibi]
MAKQKKTKEVNFSVTPYEMAVRFQQKSAEMYAVQIQAYNVAKERLTHHVKHHKEEKPLAVILDLDETVLNNMPLVAKGIQEGFAFTNWGKNWEEWVDSATADTIPGAKSFLEEADCRGVEIFYVSNRLEKDVHPTIANMQKLGLPQVSEDKILLLGERGTKKERRDKIKKDYEVALIIGNSLYDLSSVFINESTEEQIVTVEELADKFGDQFILLPNSAYGDYWVDAELDPWKGR